jgi:hypothetical protein
MAINKNFVIRNGLEVATNLIVANDVTNRIGVGTTNPSSGGPGNVDHVLDVRGDVLAYRFYGDEVKYPDWQFYGNLYGTALRAETVDNADFADNAGNANTADFATSAGTATNATNATNADNVLITNVNGDQNYYIHFNDAIGGYDDVNISSTKLVFNPFSGNLGVNAATPLTNLQVNFYGVESKTGTFSASAGTTIVDLFSVNSSNFKTAEYTLLIENSINLQTQKVLVMQNGTTSYYQESSIMYEPDIIVSVGTTISSGYCVLELTPWQGISGDITYKFYRQTML